MSLPEKEFESHLVDVEHISTDQTSKTLDISEKSTSTPLSEDSVDHNETPVPPADRGVRAWMFLIAAFIIEGIVWGYASSFGVFQDYYKTHEPFNSSGNIAVIGTCATGLPYLLTPVVIGFMIIFPRTQRWLSSIGLALMCVSLAAASFSTQTTHLVLSQGVAYGVGGCLAFTPSIIFMNEWFVERRGFAFGTVWGGSGLTGLIFPFVLQALLDKYGWQTTLRASSVALFFLGAPFLFFIKPRFPNRVYNTSSLNLKFQLDRVYIIYQLGNLIEAVGYFIPAIFLPTQARSLGATGTLSSLTVVLFNLTTVIGCAIMGYMTDRYHVTTCIMVSTVSAIIAIFVLWGLSTAVAVLYLFCAAYGFTAGTFSSTWSAVAHEVKKSEPSADLNMICAFMETGRGIGFVLSGPLSEALIKGHPWEGMVGGAYGTEYGPLIVLTGFTTLLGGLSVVGRMLKWL